MKRIICADYQEMSKYASQIVEAQIKSKPNSVLGLATGSTPLGLYNEMIKMYQRGILDFSQVTTFNLDEYYRIDKNNPQSYNYFMHANLFSHINIPAANIHIPNGDVDNVEEECANYDRMIEDAGGIDLQILGIGVNGHIGFNEPASELISGTHLTPLTIETIHANSRFFDNIEEVPKYAITMGMSNILKAKKILLLINGKNKSEIFNKLMNGNITTSIPASLLQLHPDTTIIADREAVGKVAS